jgi:hypothetical protein
MRKGENLLLIKHKQGYQDRDTLKRAYAFLQKELHLTHKQMYAMFPDIVRERFNEQCRNTFSDTRRRFNKMMYRKKLKKG